MAGQPKRNRASGKVLPVKLPIPLAPFSVVTLKNRTLTPLAQLFIDPVN
jgi:hypothetical protein